MQSIFLWMSFTRRLNLWSLRENMRWQQMSVSVYPSWVYRRFFRIWVSILIMKNYYSTLKSSGQTIKMMKSTINYLWGLWLCLCRWRTMERSRGCWNRVSKKICRKKRSGSINKKNDKQQHLIQWYIDREVTNNHSSPRKVSELNLRVTVLY